MIREAKRDDLPGLLELYLHLHEDSLPEDPAPFQRAWERILADADHHVIVCEQDGARVSSCVCVVIPNLTRGARPYALVENVVTRADCRHRGFATACLQRAADIAKSAGCYKLMLLTGAKDEPTLNFYRRAGFNDTDKTAFIRWL